MKDVELGKELKEQTKQKSAEHTEKMKRERAMADPMNYSEDEYIGPGSEAKQD